MWRKIVAVVFICLGVAGMAGTFVLWKSGTDNSIKGVSVGNFPIFDLTHPPPQPSPDPDWSLLITGDIIPARTTNWQMTKIDDFSWPLTHIAQILKNADLTLINLESPLLTNCPVTREGMKFCGNSRFAQSLADSGVDLANLANNHTLNYGWEGLAETEGHLREVGIETTGFAALPGEIQISSLPLQPFINPNNNYPNDTTKYPESIPSNTKQNLAYAKNCVKDISCSRLTVKTLQFHSGQVGQNLKIGFLGYNAVGQRIDQEIVRSEIESADTLVDVLVVSVHWGKEYERYPATDSIAQDDPQELGRLFVDWGADVVVGNHPHWYQPFDFAQGKDGVDKVIFYALGNTVFDQEWSPETKVGFLAKLYFHGKNIVKDKLEIFPLGIRDYGQAYELAGEEKEAVMTFLAR